VRPWRAADDSPSSAHTLGYTGPVAGSLYLLHKYVNWKPKNPYENWTTTNINYHLHPLNNNAFYYYGIAYEYSILVIGLECMKFPPPPLSTTIFVVVSTESFRSAITHIFTFVNDHHVSLLPSHFETIQCPLFLHCASVDTF